MQLLIVALLVVVALMWLSSVQGKKTEEQRKRFWRNCMIYGGAAAILAAVVIGRAPIWALMVSAAGAAVPWINRFMVARQMWKNFERQFAQRGNTAPPPDEPPPPSALTGLMTRAEAWQILGLKPGAEKEEILAAHRRLIQKIHPDLGGSDYLATRINQAKDKLVGDDDNPDHWT